jgi:hypothetical protein
LEITELDWIGLRAQAAKAAARVARSWPHCVTADDLEQAIMLKLIEAPESSAKLLEESEVAQRKILIAAGHRIASSEQQDYERFSGQYLYSVREVRALLEENVLTVENEAFNPVEVDLRQALDTIAPQYAEAINRRYRQGIVPPRRGAEAVRLSRAIERLTELMNRTGRARVAERSGGPSSRRAMSNARAIAASRHDSA